MTRSRRAVLAGCGAGLGALAGCTNLDIVTGGESPSYDTARLKALGRETVPRPPARFPVMIPDAMVTRHRERARTLVERVPAQPDLPNEAAVDRLQRDREEVLDRLDDGTDRTNAPSEPLNPVDRARHIRSEAARVEAAYRAATGDITPTAVTDRRAQFRAALATFERDWTYRGDDPAAATVVHATLEDLRHDASRGVTPDRPFPEPPATDIFRAGELVGELERGEAALADADRLRTRYREGLSDPRSYRTAIAVATGQLRRASHEYGRRLDEYIAIDGGPFPFDRSIEDTALEWLYRRAADGVVLFRADADQARTREQQATALLATGVSLTVLRAFETIVADIRNDRLAAPETVEDIAAARREAVDTLERAWGATPPVLADEMARWSWVLLEDARDFLRGTEYDDDYTPSTRDAHQAFANYVTATRVAAAAPRTVGEIHGALRAATT